MAVEGEGRRVPQKSTSRSVVQGAGGKDGGAAARAACCCCSSPAAAAAVRSCRGEIVLPPPPPPPPPKRKPDASGSGGGSGPESSADASSGSRRCPPKIAGVEKGQGAGRSSAWERASLSADEGGRPGVLFFCFEREKGRGSSSPLLSLSHHEVEAGDRKKKRA